jgi:DNA polymerase
VDPKERLKRYLEQRKELGERELVLDGMTVDEVMNIVGAAGGRSAARSSTTPPVSPAPASPDDPEAVPGSDWRDALRASGAAPAAPPKSKRYEFPRPDDVVADREPPSTPSRPASTTSVPGAASEASPEQTSPAPTAVPGVDAPPGLVVGSPSRDLFGTSVGKLGSLGEIADMVKACTRCSLYATATNPVPGEGNPAAELVCVGEAPGANEDATGRPFVGQSGELLTKILAAISLRREDVFICNVLKHRPPGNRNPLPEEVVACSPYLVQQLELIRPKAIVAFGTFAAQTLLNTKLPIGKLRGSVHRYHGVPLIVTYHPAALLRNPAWKRPTWEDVQLARRILDTGPRA